MTPNLSSRLILACILSKYAAALPECPTFQPPSNITGTEQESACGEENKILVESSFRVANIEQCEAACKATVPCKFFTMDKPSGNCGLRSYETSALVSVSPNQRLGTKSKGLLNCDGNVLVGKTVKIEKGGSADCQKSCQGDEKCNSWTWNKKSEGSNSEICVHNYGITARSLFVGPTSNVVSGPKTCEGTEANALFIGPTYISNQSEILLLPSLERSSCIPPSFPKTNAARYELRADDQGIHVCTGFFKGDSSSSNCFQLPFNSNTWLTSPRIPSLNEGRNGASSGNLRDGRWFIAGGYGGYNGFDFLSSIEVRNLDGTWTTANFELPLPISSHCIVNVDKNKFIITGGFTALGAKVNSFADTYLFDQSTETWITKAKMSKTRSDHTCSLIGPNMVMVAGGYTDNRPTNSTEIYSVAQNRWQNGPALPESNLLVGEMITVNNITYYIGGIRSSKIYRLDKLNESPSSWKWTAVDSESSQGTSSFGVASFKLNVENCNGWNRD